MTYINHITLQTGHIHKSHRTQVSADALAFCADLITDCLVNPNQKIALAKFDGYYFSAGNISGKSFFGTVWSGDNPLVTMIVCTKSRASLKLWKELHRHATLTTITDAHQPPQTPYAGWRNAKLVG